MNFPGDRAPQPPPKGTRPFLLWLRNEYKDDILPEVIHSNAPDNKFKVRKTWFIGLMHTLENALEEHEIKDPILQKEIRDFVSYLMRNVAKATLVKKTDIDQANEIIDKVVRALPE